jgi:small redox-active disulfide protein 2
METLGDFVLIQILGTGCTKCNRLENCVREAVLEASIDATIEKVTEMDKIMAMNVMLTPALAIDGKVVSSAKVLSKDQILKFINNANEKN